MSRAAALIAGVVVSLVAVGAPRAGTTVTCDGTTTDVTAMIQQALDAGNPVQLVRGASSECRVTTLVLPGGGTLTCEGQPGEPFGPPRTPWWTTQATVSGVHLRSFAPGAIVRLVQHPETSVGRSLIRGCGIVGDISRADQDGVVVDSGMAVLEDVTIAGVGGAGLRLRWSQGGSYTRVISGFNGAHGVAIDPRPDVSMAVTLNVFRELQVGANAGYGIVVWTGGAATLCENCDAENNRLGGIALMGAWDSVQGYMQQIQFTRAWIGCSPGVTERGIFVDRRVRASWVEQISGGCPINLDETRETWRHP